MARLKLGALFADVRGSVGSLVFKGGKQGPCLCVRSSPIQRQSPAAQARRDEMAASSAALSRLPVELRDKWRSVAEASGMSLRKAWFNTRRWLRLTAELDYWFCSGHAAAAQNWYGACYSDDMLLFCAVSENGTNRCKYSGDGAHWFYSAMPESNIWTSVCWCPALFHFVAVAYSGTNRVALSIDCTAWESAAAVGTGQWRSVCWSPELHRACAVASGGSPRVMISSNGVTWTAGVESYASNWGSVCWSPALNLFCAVAYSGAVRVMTSPDGQNWTSRTASCLCEWWSVCWSPKLNLFCAVAASGEYHVMTSPDGVVWTGYELSEARAWTGVCWSPELEMFAAVGFATTGGVMTSPDGINWVIGNTQMPVRMRNVCWSRYKAMFVAPSWTSTCEAILSPLTVKPLKADGTPLLLDNRMQEGDSNATLVSLSLARPTPGRWAFRLLGDTIPAVIEIVVPPPDLAFEFPAYAYSDSGASQTVLNVWCGLPLSGAKEVYGGPWRLAAHLLYSQGPYTLHSFTYPFDRALMAGVRLPVRLQFISRGMRFSQKVDTVAVLTT